MTGRQAVDERQVLIPTPGPSLGRHHERLALAAAPRRPSPALTRTLGRRDEQIPHIGRTLVEATPVQPERIATADNDRRNAHGACIGRPGR